MLKSLFGIQSYFGEKQKICDKIVSRLVNQGIVELHAGDDPVIVLKKIPKEVVINAAFQNTLTLDELLPFEQEPSLEETSELLKQAENKEYQAFGMDGELPDLGTIVKVILQLKALDQLFAAVPEWSSEKREFMEKTRKKYSKYFA